MIRGVLDVNQLKLCRILAVVYRVLAPYLPLEGCEVVQELLAILIPESERVVH